MTANKNRYADNRQKRVAYENACDCLYFGMGSQDWCRNGLEKEDAAEVWATAFYDMSDGVSEWAGR